MAGKPGRSGRRPKPTNLLKFEGGYRKDRHGDGISPDPRAEIPDPPKALGKGEALAEWNRITALLIETKCVTKLDRASLAAYCLEWARYVNANNKLRFGKTLMAESTKGTKMPHPLLRVSDRALSNMLRICMEFGLTPASRSRLRVQAMAEQEDPLERLIRQQAQARQGKTAGSTG